MSLEFDHIGIVTTETKPGEIFIAPTRVWVTDFAKHLFRVEWLRFEPDSPVTGPVREGPHIAYRVKSIVEASQGMRVLLPAFDVGFATVAFYQSDDGVIVEFMEYKQEGVGLCSLSNE